MASPWKDLTIVTPADGEAVWIRRLLINYPIVATWSAASATFTTSNGLTLPWYFVGYWRPT